MPTPEPYIRPLRRPEDFLVEYRDKNLIRQGAIPSQDLSLKFQPVFNGVGSWSLSLPAEHSAVPFLRAPGSGIIITNLITGNVEMSGLTSTPTKSATSSEPKGMATISGLSDDRLLWDAISFPEPGNADVSTQTESNDVRSGAAELMMRDYVAFNIANGSIRREGPTAWAPAGRLGGFRSLLRLEAIPGSPLGPTLIKSPRFQNLGDLLVEIALEAGGLGFRVVQIDGYLEFQVYQPSDMTAEIRLDVANGTLSDQSVEFAPPDMTRIVVAGQGEGVDRQLFEVTTPDSEAAEDDWGLIIEQFKDQRQTDVEDELISAATGDLVASGFTKVAVKATPSDDQTMVFMEDFFLGDKITIVLDGQEPTSNVTEAAVVIDSTGVHTGVAIGDIADFDRTSALRQTVQDNTKRIANLETNVEPTPSTWPWDRIDPTPIPDSQLPARLVGANVTDFNTCIDDGWYYGTSASNMPVDVVGSTQWMVFVKNFITTTAVKTVFQTATRPGTNNGGRTWYRYSTNFGFTWTTWTQSLGSHIGDTLSSNGRAYFSTDPMEGGATQQNGAAYLAMSPDNGADPGQLNAAWLQIQGGNVLLQVSKSNKKPFYIYDSDWVTTGLTITPATGVAISSYRLRRVGDRVMGKIVFVYSGSTLTADASANFTDTLLFTMPAGWQEGSGMFDGTSLHMERSGVTPYWGRAANGNPNGSAGQILLITGTFPSQTFPGGTYEMQIDYYVN